MTMKEQEYKALEKIRKIVEDVGGKDSYIGMAFEGCFELAEQNIENDWGCSMQQRVDQMSKSLEEANKKLANVNLELTKARNFGEMMEHRVEEYKAEYAKTVEDLRDARDGLERVNRTACELESKLETSTAQTKAIIDGKDQEIMQLKARLFDLLYANKETA